MADDARATTGSTELNEVIGLWPDGPPSSIADMPAEITFRAPAANGPETTMLRNVSEPTLTVFRPAPGRANGVGVIVAPGGGWRILAWEHEGVDVAAWLATRGYTAFLLKYRLAASHPDPQRFAESMAAMSAPLNAPRPAAERPRAIEDIMRDEATKAARRIGNDDGRRALAIVRERAADWGVAPGRIGMMGFSAGAFLTVDVALEPGQTSRPAFIAPIYGGGTAGRPVPDDAPPLFACIAQDDRMLIKVVEGLYRAWSDADRPCELHVFARGGHGFGSVKRGLPCDAWMDLLGAWLVDQGF